MQTTLSPQYADTPDGLAAQALLGKCVHCGFCTATCPTYQLLGDELDGPRGRIYQIKEVLEGAPATRSTQLHLDRCLTCRNCETTCPSGVQYGQLLDIGRKLVDQQVARPLPERFKRWALKRGLNSPLFAPAMRLGQMVRQLLPPALKAKVPAKQIGRALPTQVHTRKVLLLAGCVQPAMLANINTATARVLDVGGIQTIVAPNAACCGAINHHLNDQVAAAVQIRANIDAWWPYIEALENPVEAIVFNASGCGVMVKDYAHLLVDDPNYAAKARRVTALARDVSELLPSLHDTLAARLKLRGAQTLPRIAYHPPCTLQHGQQLHGGVEHALRALGFTLAVARVEPHLCCGSAGTYSVLQPQISYALRDRKLNNLQAIAGDVIASANVGCITHLQSGTDTLVRHWIEILDDALSAN